MSSFEELHVDKDIIKALIENGIVTPTPIQEEAIPLLMYSSSDFVGNAPTGTGKTLAYAIPLIQMVDVELTKPQVLILAPTRELCRQISKEFFKFTKYTSKIFTELVIGGKSLSEQSYRLTRPTHVIVATPGRLLELINTNNLSLEEIRTVVIDEADEIITMGFKQELDEILNVMSQKAFTWMVSATFPEDLQKMIKKYLSKDCRKVILNNTLTINPNILHQYFVCSKDEKPGYILDFINMHEKVKGIVFTRTQYKVKELADFLRENGVSVAEMHGEMKQIDREKSIRMFRTGKVKVLVSTDISSRGIDIDDISYVVHENIPETFEMYIHRSGRTARGNRKGIAISFAAQNEIGSIKKIETMLKIKFNKVR